MRKLGRLLLLAGVTALAGLILVGLRRRKQQQRRHQRRYGHGADGHRAGLPRPPGDVHDPGGYEAGWISWTRLLVTYKHEDGQAGNELIPGSGDRSAGRSRRTARPTRYTLRKGPRLLRRLGRSRQVTSPTRSSAAIKLNWGGKSFYTGYIKGADAYRPASRRRSPASPPRTRGQDQDSELTSKYGAFQNLLAFPSARPAAEQHEDEEPIRTSRLPASARWMIKNVVPNRS